MIDKNKKKSLNQYELNIDDMVVGMHKEGFNYIVIVGKITSILNLGKDIIFKVKGKNYKPNYSADFSGELKESEIEIIDQDICNRMIELYDLAIKQITSSNINFVNYHKIVEEINTTRFTEREKLKGWIKLC